MKYSLCLDIGTTNIRCAICDPIQKNPIKNIVYDKLQIIYLPGGYVEIDSQQLWAQILQLIHKCISTSNISIDQVSSLGISAQRNTFVTWDKTSGKEFHNLIVWKDLRAKELVEEYNNKSWSLWALNNASKLLYRITGQKRFLAGSVLKFMNAQVSLRLLWILTHNQSVCDNIVKKNVLFGTLDTWLIYKLTNGAHHITDVSHAASTGLYDPFTLGWAQWALSLFKIPVSILPKVLATWNGREDICVHSEHLGREIPIRVSITDQSASMYGLSCVKKGDIKLTMGTGSFMDVNTCDKPHASLEGLYPLVGWQLSSKRSNVVYLVEGSSYGTGSLIEFCKTKGLFSNVEETSALASSVPSSGGVVFAMGFSGLQDPSMQEPNSVMGFLHHTENTMDKKYFVRALLDSVAFRVKQIYDIMLKETEFQFKTIRVDGGCSRNDFLCQLIADLTQVRVWRPSQTESSIVGVAKLISDCEKNKLDHPVDEDEFEVDGTEFLPRFELYEQHMNTYRLWSMEMSVCWASDTELR
ncbi:hypothetical protein WDU94_000533 [Cyamophila willieti]